MALVEWASDLSVKTDIKYLASLMQLGMGEAHWSRMFEYPWVLLHGNFQEDHIVLDAGGGDGALQVMLACQVAAVINVDSSYQNLSEGYERFHKNASFRKVSHLIGDLNTMWPLPDHFFDRVVCVSVLEHSTTYKTILDSLWRVLKPGGRLLVTMDVTTKARHNHTIDDGRAREILSYFRLEMPPVPDNILRWQCEEWDAQPGEDPVVPLRCLCFYCNKEGSS